MADEIMTPIPFPVVVTVPPDGVLAAGQADLSDEIPHPVAFGILDDQGHDALPVQAKADGDAGPNRRSRRRSGRLLLVRAEVPPRAVAGVPENSSVMDQGSMPVASRSWYNPSGASSCDQAAVTLTFLTPFQVSGRYSRSVPAPSANPSSRSGFSFRVLRSQNPWATSLHRSDDLQVRQRVEPARRHDRRLGTLRPPERAGPKVDQLAAGRHDEVGPWVRAVIAVDVGHHHDHPIGDRRVGQVGAGDRAQRSADDHDQRLSRGSPCLASRTIRSVPAEATGLASSTIPLAGRSKRRSAPTLNSGMLRNPDRRAIARPYSKSLRPSLTLKWRPWSHSSFERM